MASKWLTNLLFAFLLLSSLKTTAYALSEDYVVTTAKAGDGVYSLLRRFDISAYSCNIKKFYELNGINKNSGLKVGKTYLLPIRSYTYNGKSIRSTLGISDYKLAVEIQDYNNFMHERGMRDQLFIKDKILWVPHHFLNCPEPDILSELKDLDGGETKEIYDVTFNASVKGVYPIFGKKYQKVLKESNRLKNRVYYIVSGHGGPDPGAVGKKNKSNLCEDEYAYDVALRLCRKLVANGATAYMIVRDNNDGIRDEEILLCDYDEVVWGNYPIPRNQKKRLDQRADIINQLHDKHSKQGVKSQELIVIHVDSRQTNKQIDLFFYYRQNDAESKRLAIKLHDTIKNKYKIHRASGHYSGTYTTRDLHMLRETKPSAVFIELGNIKNSWDQKRILPKSNRDAVANWLYEGLIQ